MKYRQLGKTGLRASVVGVGTWQFGGEWGHAFSTGDVEAILGRARDLGINLIDTAECYGDHLSEALIGSVINQDRASWIVATKFGHRYQRNYEREQLWSPKDVAAQLDASLRALRTDYIDLYQCHSARDADFDQPALWEMLNRQVQAGKIRYLGISISPNDNIHQTERATQVGASAIQVVYNRLDRGAERAVLASCRSQNLGVLARVPLASGFLSGKYRPGATFTNPDDVRSLRDDADTQRQLQLVQEIYENEVPQGVPMAAWALGWCLQNSAVTCVIPGCKSPEQVAANAAAADLDIEPRER